ncbi:MAG: hypothetical protein JSS51_11395 [Planctomycetes bacterium]|nr:hypothetical protein [Planctomycetota bacterium]
MRTRQIVLRSSLAALIAGTPLALIACDKTVESSKTSSTKTTETPEGTKKTTETTTKTVETEKK